MVRLLVVVGVMLLAAAGAARADIRIARAPVESIQMSGRAVAWQETTFDVESADNVLYMDRIVRRRPGGRETLLARPSSSLDSNFEEGDDVLRWDVSSTALVTGVGTADYEAADERDGARIRGGLIGRPAFTFAACEDRTTGDPPPVSVWGNLVAYTNVCGAERLLIRDLAHPRRDPLFRRYVGDDEFDLAGHYIAIGNHYDPKAGIAVYDWRTGALLYTVAADLWADEDRAGTFELQPDGKLAAVLVGRGYYCEAAWYSPAEPKAHVVGRTSCGADIRLHSDQLAWMRVGKRRGQLIVTRLGHVGRAVVRFPMSPPGRGAFRLYTSGTVEPTFAWDGRRLAYALRSCDRGDALFLRRRVAGPARRDRAPLRCPLRVGSRVLRVKRGANSVRIPLRCPRGCTGSFDIRRSNTRSAGIDQPFVLGRRGTGRRIFLDDRTRSALARHGTARMRVWIDSDGRLGGERHDVRFRLYGG